MTTFLMPEISWVHAGIVLVIVSLFCYVARSVTGKELPAKLGWSGILLALICLAISLVLRSQAAQYFALSNMYESMLVLIMWLMVGFLILDARFKLPSLGWPVCLMLLAALAFDVNLSRDIHPLQAALQSYWRSIHVPIIILSYAMFTLAFISSVIQLVKSYREGNGKPDASGNPKLAAEGPDNMVMTTRMMVDGKEYHPGASKNISFADTLRLDNAALYDEITYRCVAVGFPLLAIGIILGAMWANEAWGNYWSWDPKESMSLVTLLGYGVYLHLRVNGEHSSRSLAWVSVVGFVLMLITYFGVNIMGVGLHSYGKIE